MNIFILLPLVSLFIPFLFLKKKIKIKKIKNVFVRNLQDEMQKLKEDYELVLEQNSMLQADLEELETERAQEVQELRQQLRRSQQDKAITAGATSEVCEQKIINTFMYFFFF